MKKLDITHVTEVGGNLFEDLGFPADEAKKLKADADSVIEAKHKLMGHNRLMDR